MNTLKKFPRVVLVAVLIIAGLTSVGVFSKLKAYKNEKLGEKINDIIDELAGKRVTYAGDPCTGATVGTATTQAGATGDPGDPGGEDAGSTAGTSGTVGTGSTCAGTCASTFAGATDENTLAVGCGTGGTGSTSDPCVSTASTATISTAATGAGL